MDDFNDISNIIEEINCSLVENLTIDDENPINETSKLLQVTFSCFYTFSCFFFAI